MLHDVWPRIETARLDVSREAVRAPLRRAMSRRLPLFAFCWIGATAPWYGLLVSESLVTPARALTCLIASGATLIVVAAVCRRDPAAWPMGVMLGAACWALAAMTTWVVAGAHGSAESLAFMMLTLYLAAALFFAWGWYAETAIVLPTVLLWLWAAPSLRFHLATGELSTAILTGSLLAVLMAEGAHRSFRLAFLHQSAEKQARRQLESARDEAERARHAAEAATRAKDEFLATVSHELRSPLGAVLSWAQTLRQGRWDWSTFDRALHVIEANARTQARLIEDLLDVSRIVAGKMSLDLAPTDLRAPVSAAVEAARPRATAARVRIDVAMDPEPVTVIGDATRLGQVIHNLIANAVKFTPPGGAVAVRVRSGERHAYIHVDDNGIGIAPECLPRIFDRFAQSTVPSSSGNRGLGLGLSITRDIVEMHGGVIAASSAGVGCGASFQVSIPLTSAAATARGCESAADASLWSSCRTK